MLKFQWHGHGQTLFSLTSSALECTVWTVDSDTSLPGNLSYLFVLLSKVIKYTGSLARADFTGAFFLGAQFQKVPKIVSSCGFLYCSNAHSFTGAHTSEGITYANILISLVCT